MSDKSIDDDGDTLLIIYMMAKSDGLSDKEAHDAVHKHLETGCGYNFKHREE